MEAGDLAAHVTQLDALDAAANVHCAGRGYTVVASTQTRDGYRALSIEVPGKEGLARLAYNGEVFSLSFPGGYGWAEFAYRDEDRVDALHDILGFLDAYSSGETREVTVRRRLRRDRRELHVSNGAVLRRRGWSSGPTG